MKANAFSCVRTNLDMAMKIVVAMGAVEKQVYFPLLQKVRNIAVYRISSGSHVVQAVVSWIFANVINLIITTSVVLLIGLNVM